MQTVGVQSPDARFFARTYWRTVDSDTAIYGISALMRAQILRAVCRCFRGILRSASRIPSIKGITGPNPGLSRSGRFRSGGHASASACRTIRRCTLNFRASPLIVASPNSYSLRICSNNSTFVLLSTRASCLIRQSLRSFLTGGPNQSITGGRFRVSKSASLTSSGAELSAETLTAWDAYVEAQNARLAEYSSAAPFLWSDKSPDRLRRLHTGETLVAPFGENPHGVPQGLIHHWIGAIFLPGVRLDDVLSVVRDYGKYKDFYAPNVVESQAVR